MTGADFVVVGGGVMGITIASELRRRYADAGVVVLEKEPAPGLHASGRNSGVLHAGFYYTPDSLKARFTRDGNRWMREYCQAKGLRLNACGKLVLAKDEADLAGLRELRRRGEQNGVTLVELDELEARKLEPRARTHEKALFSPTTATVDPAEVMRSLVADAEGLGVRVMTGAAYLGRRPDGVRTAMGDVACGYLVNAAGLYADRVARDFGYSHDYRIMPFKGLYLYSSEPAGAFRTNLYPVPDLQYPFLGVHFTVTVDGGAKIGPTAIPCLWREQYGWSENFRLSECVEIAGLGLQLLLRAGFDFRRLAREELKKIARRTLVAQAARLATGLEASQYTRWGRPGIRAQLVDLRTRTLVQDFVLEGDRASFHVLNAVSPGWTCAVPFASFVCDRIDALLHGHPAEAGTTRAVATPVPA